MFTFFIVLIIISSLLLIGLVMLQNSQKDGGNSMANELGGLQLMGVQQTNSTLTNSTITLIFVIFIGCFLSNKVLKKNKHQSKYNISKELVNTENATNITSGNENNEKESDGNNEKENNDENVKSEK